MYCKKPLALCLLSMLIATPAIAQDRVLHFPADRSLGKLTLLDDPDEEKPWHWKSNLKWWQGLEYKPELGEAQGDVQIPADARVGLIVSGDELPDLSPLVDLEPGQIESLYIWPRKVKPGDACLIPVSKIVGLKTLFLINIGITPAGWDALARMTSLERLKVNDDLDEADAAQVARMKFLRCLSFATITPVSADTVSTLATLPLLEELDIGWLQPTAYASLKDLTTVRTLNLSGWPHGVENVAYLASMPNLESLWFGDLSNEELAALPDMPKLKALQIQGRGYEYTAAAFANLSCYANLEKLTISSYYNDETVQALPVLPSLKSLSLADTPMVNGPYNPLTDAALVHICRLSSLEYLSISDGTYTEEGLQHLSELPSLKALSIFNTKLSDAGMAHIGKCSRLEYLNVPITVAGLAQIDGLSQLKELALPFKYDSKITREAIARLQEKIPALTVTEWPPR